MKQANKIRTCIQDYRFLTVDHITASFGIAMYSQGDDQQSLVKRADDQLYKAKDAGRNCAV